jgi:multiple sugar transport system substrate-binding protein
MRKHIFRRTAVAGIAIVAAAAALTGCTSGGSQSSSSGQHVTLTFQSLAFQDTTVKATKEIVAAFNKSHPDITVDLRQGSWDNVHDQLVTEFEGGTAPDIIHEAADDIQGFAQQGYLANLKPYLSTSVKDSVSQGVWKSVTSADGTIFAAPTLLQSYVVFANTAAFKAAGVAIPTGKTMSWDTFAKISKELSVKGKYGLGWSLQQPTATVMNLGLNFDGTFFTTKADGTSSIKVGANELQVPERIKAMAYTDKSLDPATLTESGTDTLPGFFGDKYAMYVGGNYVAQQITQTAPKGFDWTVLPTLTGTAGAAQAADPQTMSVSAQSKHVKQAAEFINYWMSAKNQAALGEGDWLAPASSSARALIEKQTGGKNGWNVALEAGAQLKSAPFLSESAYPQWNDQIATPALQKYFANTLTSSQLAAQLTSGWTSVGGQ